MTRPLLCSATTAALSWFPSAAAGSSSPTSSPAGTATAPVTTSTPPPVRQACVGLNYFKCKAAAQDCVWSPEQQCASHLSHSLVTMSQAELDALYRSAPAGAIPHGKGYGTALFAPDLPATNIGLAGIAQAAWQGKFFDKDAGTLQNSVLGAKAIKASVYHAESWFDGERSIILDYSQDAPGAFKIIRDEIRQIAPREYLGRVYLFMPSKPFIINFALEFAEEQVPESTPAPTPAPTPEAWACGVCGKMTVDDQVTRTRVHIKDVQTGIAAVVAVYDEAAVQAGTPLGITHVPRGTTANVVTTLSRAVNPGEQLLAVLHYTADSEWSVSAHGGLSWPGGVGTMSGNQTHTPIVGAPLCDCGDSSPLSVPFVVSDTVEPGLTVQDQEAWKSVVIEEVWSDGPGHIVVHEYCCEPTCGRYGDGKGEVVGNVGIPTGRSTNVVVPINPPKKAAARRVGHPDENAVKDGETLFAMLHTDLDGDGEYESLAPSLTGSSPAVSLAVGDGRALSINGEGIAPPFVVHWPADKKAEVLAAGPVPELCTPVYNIDGTLNADGQCAGTEKAFPEVKIGLPMVGGLLLRIASFSAEAALAMANATSAMNPLTPHLPSSFFQDGLPWMNWYTMPDLGEAFARLSATRSWLDQTLLWSMYLPKFGGFPARDQACTTAEASVRQADGSCNDPQVGLMGAVGTRFGRNSALLLGDGSMSPHTRGEVMPELGTPSPREIARKLLGKQGPMSTARRTGAEVPFLNLLGTAWIQFMVHDWFSHGAADHDLSTVFRFPLSNEDPWRAQYQIDEMVVPRTTRGVARSAAEAAEMPPMFENKVTHWWDGSQIYGSSAATTHRLRANDGTGKLRMDAGLLPRDDFGMAETGHAENFWVGLESLHTLFAREHNAICDMLKARYPQWSDDQLFAKARLITAAVMAKIHTVEWTPAVIPNRVLDMAMNANWKGFNSFLSRPVDPHTFEPLPEHYRALLKSSPGYRATLLGIVGQPRDLKTDPVTGDTVPFALTEEFVSVYRMHPLLPEDVHILGDDGQRNVSTSFPLHQTRNRASHRLMQQHGLQRVAASIGTQKASQLVLFNYPDFLRSLPLDGLNGCPAAAGSSTSSSSTTGGNQTGCDTDALPPGSDYPSLAQGWPEDKVKALLKKIPAGAFDLAAVDIIRDRERGVPRYNAFRALMKLRPVESIDQLTEDATARDALKEVYGDDVDAINRVDLVVGLMAEGTRPTCYGFTETAFQVFVVMASRRLQADRFYTDLYNAETYTQEGLDWVSSNTMKDVLLRHEPGLAHSSGLPNVNNAFFPWKGGQPAVPAAATGATASSVTGDSASNAAKQEEEEHSSGVPRPAAAGFAAVCSAVAALCAGGAMFIVGRKRGHAAGDSDHADTVSLDAVPSKQLALTQHEAGPGAMDV